VNAANQLRNKSPTSTQTTTPYQAFTGEIPNKQEDPNEKKLQLIMASSKPTTLK